MNLTNLTANIDYETVTSVTQSPVILIVIIAIWFLPILLYLIIGGTKRAKSPSGQTYSKKMWAYPNYWISFFIMLLVHGTLLMLGLIYPIWLKILS